MPKGRLYARKEPILDDLIIASIALGMDKIHPLDQHDMDNSFYATLIYDEGLKTKEDAEEIRRALKRAAQAVSRRKSYPEVSVNCWAEKKPLGGYKIKYRACCKECARAWLIKTHGEDRSRWPYDPRRRIKDSQ